MAGSSLAAYASRPWLASYPDGVPAEIDMPTGSLVDLIDHSVSEFGATVALQFFGRRITYTQLGERISSAAEALRRLGVKAGDRVALVLPNCPQLVVAFYAVLRLGAIVVEHNPLYTATELEQQFADHGAGVAVVWNKAAEKVANLPDPVRPAAILSVDLISEMPVHTRLALRLPLAKSRSARAQLTTEATLTGTDRWDRLVHGPTIDPAHVRPSIDDVAVLQYTSGTTGAPKGAILTHGNLVANAAQGRAWVPGLQPGKETIYAVLPLFHAYGLTLCLTYAMSIGATLVLFPRFDVDLVLDAMRRTPATFLPGVPPIYERLVVGAARRSIKLTGIRYSLSGAMSLPAATIKIWEEVTGGLLVEGYGLTETSPVALGNPMGPARRPGTVGIPFPSTEIRVVDPDDPASDRPVGVAGELLIRGPQVFSGYWNRPAETAAALLPGGWLRSGDIVTMSADGFVTVVDRIKELIITGGFNVAPTEVEEQLMEHPDVVAAAVVGVPSRSGEDVMAAVVLRDGALFDSEALREFCRRRLTAYKVPKRIVRVDELPRSLIGKVLRRQVRSTIMAVLQANAASSENPPSARAEDGA
ncbi:long-chain-fatty-acid--CoA ligase [Lacisediminihabitans profunda]|uniref:AMP-binding protein n=1 Tax=Lacisediminihabitans profunda TaxID=2594790 RepID=A0A5C8UTH6_9MICO|nr:long-chain-fatty-acid--CoA ligase [Lacisediminihabitans profunda]TXN30916.1 AMP-binding protein [Lacisediminihabitans profunda]